jgi:hypothetical protein
MDSKQHFMTINRLASHFKLDQLKHFHAGLEWPQGWIFREPRLEQLIFDDDEEKHGEKNLSGLRR